MQARVHQKLVEQVEGSGTADQADNTMSSETSFVKSAQAVEYVDQDDQPEGEFTSLTKGDLLTYTVAEQEIEQVEGGGTCDNSESTLTGKTLHSTLTKGHGTMVYAKKYKNPKTSYTSSS